MRVRLEVSARHCHVTAEDVRKLFGPGYRLRARRPISQPGQYAAMESVRVKIGNGETMLRIVGPERTKTQVEISLTEAIKLGIDPPISYFDDSRARGVACTLIGPKGKVLRRAVIVARRHVHCDPATAKRLQVRHHQVVSVRTKGPRSMTLHHVIVRVHPTFRFRCHLDTDEANAAGIKGGEWGEIVA